MRFLLFCAPLFALLTAANAQVAGCCLLNPGTSYLGNVGTRMMLNDSEASPFAMSREAIYLPNGATNFKVLLQNFYTDANNVEHVNGPVTVRASIEYPPGTCTQVTWSSASSVTSSSPLFPLSDTISLTVPAATTIYFREYNNSNSSSLTHAVVNTFTEGGSTNSSVGDAFNADPVSANVPDQTSSCDTIANTGGQYGAAIMTPAALVVSTTHPSPCLLGDSTMQGYPTGQDANGDMGIVAPSLRATMGYINFAIGATDAQEYVGNSTVRQSLYQYCSHLISGYGLIDVEAGDTASQVEGYLSQIYSLFSRPIFQTTIMPAVTTTDACATTGNQGTQSFETVRGQVNSDLRSNAFGPNGGFFDVDSVVGTGSNFSLWKVSPQAWGLVANSKCIHPTLYGDAQIQASGIVDAGRIAR